MLNLPSSITESVGFQFHECVLLLSRTLVRGPASSRTRGYADANLLAFPACNYALEIYMHTRVAGYPGYIFFYTL